MSGNLQGGHVTGVDGGKQGDEGKAREEVRSQNGSGLVTHIWAFNFLDNEELQRNGIRGAF